MTLEESYLQLQTELSDTTQRSEEFKEEYLNIWAQLVNLQTQYNALLKSSESRRVTINELQEEMAKDREESRAHEEVRYMIHV